MLSLLWTIPALPLAGFVALALFGHGLTRREAGRIGAGSVGLSAIVTLFAAARFAISPPHDFVYTQDLWTWVQVDGLAANVSFRLDALSLVMVLVVTVIGFLIHVYSTGYMADDADYARFFAYMNLFVASMLTLVLADNLLLLFLGWEGVGLCSYLLIGFWYKDPANGRAATKAFLVTRVGDAFMAVGLFLLIAQFGTLHIATILEQAPQHWAQSPAIAATAGLLLLGGALGKSGQLPLQVWLPDAMAGPTPVSALIHAATMVTAGVYLIARMHTVFELAPAVQHLVAVIGAVTLLFAGGCALVQRDIKRVLAYSTISQIGYMFLALGVGAWSAAMFHFFTHAIFKALLFMAAGAVIVALHHEQDMFKMGGLRTRLPIVFWTFLIGAMSLSALPLLTAGFYSKDMILYEVWSSDRGGRALWAAGFVGAFVTAVYTFRMVFITFFGEAKTRVSHEPGLSMTAPLMVLALGATFAGLIELPRTLGNMPLFSRFMEHTLPAAHVEHTAWTLELALQGLSECAVALGIILAYVLWFRKTVDLAHITSRGIGKAVYSLLNAGWGFDWLYDRLFVLPYGASARANRNDGLDSIYGGVVQVAEECAYALRRTQSGRVRWYLAGIAVGAIIAVYLVVYL